MWTEPQMQKRRQNEMSQRNSKMMATAGQNPMVISGIRHFKLPTFSGGVVKDDLNPLDFVERIETYCKATGRDANDKCMVMHLALWGNATIWWRSLKRRGINPGIWDEVKYEFLRTYAPTITGINAIGQLEQKGIESVNDYFGRLDQIIEEMMSTTMLQGSEQHGGETVRNHIQMYLFIGGLKEPIRTDVLKRGTSSLAEALKEASKSELIHKEQNKIFYFEEKARAQNPNELDLEDEEIAAINQRRIRMGKKPFREHNPLKIECYNCNKMGHIAKYCNAPRRWTNKAVKESSQDDQKESDSSDQVLSIAIDLDLERDLINKIDTHPFHNEIFEMAIQSRPFVKATIDNQTYKMLYDTGSSISCMSYEIMQKLKDQKVKLVKLKIPSREFTSADGVKLRSLGICKLNLKIENKQIQSLFHVIPKLHENFILGIDFIKDKQLHLCLRDHQFYWNDKCPLEHGQPITAKKEITIAQQSSKLCRVQVPPNPKDNNNIVSVVEISTSTQPCTQGTATIIKQQASNLPVLELFNTSLVAPQIKRNEIKVSGEARNPTTIQVNDGLTINSAPYQMDPFLKGQNGNTGDYLGQCDLLQHGIDPTEQPVDMKQFKITKGHQKVVNQQVKEMLKLKPVQTSCSMFSNPIFIVNKKDGSFRLVPDFRAPNHQTSVDKYSMRYFTECIPKSGRSESTIFSNISLTSGNWLLVLEAKMRTLTSFTVYGMSQFGLKTSKGLLGRLPHFQKPRRDVTKGKPKVTLRTSYILIHSKTHEQPRKILEQLIHRPKQQNLKIKVEKCQLGKPGKENPGFKLKHQGMLPGTEKVKALRNTHLPTVHQVQQFLGWCIFLRQHRKPSMLHLHPSTKHPRKHTKWKVDVASGDDEFLGETGNQGNMQRIIHLAC